MRKAALVVVDVQKDFCEGGALAAANTMSLLAPLKTFIDEARRRGVLIVYTRDWHPDDHSSFHTAGGPWPVHCVAEQQGSELMAPLHAEPQDLMIHKGVGVEGAGYSGFDETVLEPELLKEGITKVGIAGIATEYCVRATALDAHKAKFDTTVLNDLIRAVKHEDGPRVLAELRQAGIEVADADAWLAEVRAV
jgi:nicotinamidase/pyrazinamidase